MSLEQELDKILKNFPSFEPHEFMCKCGCRKQGVKIDTVRKLKRLRSLYGRAMGLTSAYRCKDHPEEKKKEVPGGRHYEGIAFDIQVSSKWERALLVHLAIKAGWKGIGIADTFVHIDDREDYALWTY